MNNTRRHFPRSGGVRRWGHQEDRTQEEARNRPIPEGYDWKRIDLHLHTPASSDYRDPGISYLDILKKAEDKRLDMIAFADHNTVAGYAAMHREIETLQLLERLNRLTDIERSTLNEYRRLLSKIVVLPAFEFTATFGFHILGVFPENTSIRKLEHLLLDLNVPEEKMVAGAPDAGSTSDVLNAYQMITSAGGLAIAAHANSSNGVAMQGFPFGGQTKIAYTQDPNLAALEVTDLEVSGRRTTASFFNASKPEYPRRMHCIQGSDAHSLNTEQLDSANKRLGVGARITEILVKEASFAALKELLTGDDFTRTRAYRQVSVWESVDKARTNGPNLAQAFHERAISRTSGTRPLMNDIVAFANTNGGTIYLGAAADTRMPVLGIERPEEEIKRIKEEVHRSVEPALELDFETKQNGDRAVVIINVPKGGDPPYIFAPTGQIYIRDGATSMIASRDEIVDLVMQMARARGMQLPGRAAIERPVSGEPIPRSQAVAPAARAGRGTTSSPQPRQQQPAPVQSQPQQDRKAAPVPAPASESEERVEQRPPAQRQPARQPEQRAAQPQETPQPAVQPQRQEEAVPQVRPARPPHLANLPPEKIKGRIQPMLPLGTQTPAAGGTEQVTAEAAATGQPTAQSEATPEAVQPAEVAPGVVAQAEPEAAPSTSRRPSRGRSRRKTEQPAVEAEVAAGEAGPEGDATTLMPAGAEMQATVASEHETREEIVAEATAEALPEAPLAPEKSRRRRRNTAKAEQAEAVLEVEAPTAAAAATEAGEEAILVAAEVEPGPQIPAELPPGDQTWDAAVAPVEKKGSRSRRRKGAEPAPAEPVAQAEAPAVPKEPAQEARAEAAAPAQKGRSRGRKKKDAGEEAAPAAEPEPPAEQAQASPIAESPEPPGTGVEVVDSELRNNTYYHTMRDLRNKSTVHNVTRQSARRLWHYAILQHERGNPDLAEVFWHPDLPIGLWRRDNRAGAIRYDLACQRPDGTMQVYYGVTDEGLHGPWLDLVRLADEAGYVGPDPIGGNA